MQSEVKWDVKWNGYDWGTFGKDQKKKKSKPRIQGNVETRLKQMGLLNNPKLDYNGYNNRLKAASKDSMESFRLRMEKHDEESIFYACTTCDKPKERLQQKLPWS